MKQLFNAKAENIKSDSLVKGFSIDSRTLMEGDLFFCIKGKKTDGAGQRFRSHPGYDRKTSAWFGASAAGGNRCPFLRIRRFQLDHRTGPPCRRRCKCSLKSHFKKSLIF